MSIQMSSQVWKDKSVTNLADRLVLLAIADCHNPQLGCFPSIQTLSEKTCMTERGVRKSIMHLTKAEKINKTPGGGRGQRNGYLINCLKTLNNVQGLTPPETLNIIPETLNIIPETLNNVPRYPEQYSGFPIGENENSEAPNRKGTVTNSKGADDLFEKATKKRAGNAANTATPKAQLHSKPQDLAEIVEYCKSIQIPQFDAEWFDAHWQGNGFTVSGKPMKDWKAVIRSWKIAGHLQSQKKNTNSAGEFKPKQKGFCDL